MLSPHPKSDLRIRLGKPVLSSSESSVQLKNVLHFTLYFYVQTQYKTPECINNFLIIQKKKSKLNQFISPKTQYSPIIKTQNSESHSKIINKVQNFIQKRAKPNNHERTNAYSNDCNREKETHILKRALPVKEEPALERRRQGHD